MSKKRKPKVEYEEVEVVTKVLMPIYTECQNSGYKVHPQNGWVKGVRCSRGCRVRCSICSNPNCDNPDGQH